LYKFIDDSSVDTRKQVKRENQDDVSIDSPITKKAKPSGGYFFLKVVIFNQ